MRSSLRTVKRVLGVNAVAASCAAAQGAGAAEPDSTARHLRKVQVTESRTPTTVGGASALVLTTDRLRDSPAPVLEQVLREIPFVNVRQNSRGEMELSIRGSDSRQAAIMLDGVPLTLGWDHRADPGLIPLSGSEEVVVVRGLGSLLGGPNALGGTIDVSQGRTTPTAGTRQVWGGFGTDDHAAVLGSLGASRTVAAPGGVVTLRGGLSHRDRPGVRVPAAAGDATARNGLRTNSDLRQTDALASLRWAGRAGRALGAMLTGFDAERGVPPEEHLEGPRFWRYPYTRRLVAALSGSAGAFATPFGYGTFDASVGYNGGTQKIESFTDRSYTTVAGTEVGDERTWTVRAKATHSLPAGAMLSTAYTRAAVRYDETLPLALVARYRQVLWSAGAEVDVPLGERTKVGAGAAFDRSTSPETGGRETGQPPLESVGWRAGLRHEFGSGFAGHASVSRRARFPSLRELYSGALNRFQPNPALRPESLLGVEAGVTFRGPAGVVPDASLQLTAFSHRLNDAVARTTLSNPTRFMRVNRDRIESAGIELVTGVVFGSDGDRAVTLDVDATVQRIRLVDATAGVVARHAENNPEVRVTGSLGVPLVRGARLVAATRYSGRQYCLNGETGAEIVLGAQAATDAGVERQFVWTGGGPFTAMRALVSLDNVANAAVYDQCGLPQPGRTLRVMFSVR